MTFLAQMQQDLPMQQVEEDNEARGWRIIFGNLLFTDQNSS